MNSPARILAPILLSSEVGSEGLDLQFASAMVNYDLPWNPMVVEQRIGRIHRIGQKAERIVVINLICEGTADERIYDRLYLRLDLFRSEPSAIWKLSSDRSSTI